MPPALRSQLYVDDLIMITATTMVEVLICPLQVRIQRDSFLKFTALIRNDQDLVPELLLQRLNISWTLGYTVK